MNQSAYDLVYRIVQFQSGWRSMKQLREVVRRVLIVEGFKAELPKFKLKQSGPRRDKISIFIRKGWKLPEHPNYIEASPPELP